MVQDGVWGRAPDLEAYRAKTCRLRSAEPWSGTAERSETAEGREKYNHRSFKPTTPPNDPHFHAMILQKHGIPLEIHAMILENHAILFQNHGILFQNHAILLENHGIILLADPRPPLTTTKAPTF